VSAVEALLRRERAVVALAMLALAALAWLYLWRGAGMGMPALHMTSLAFFPHLQPAAAGEMPAHYPMVAAMWWVMMIAMMTPSVAPLVLLYGRVMRHHGEYARAAPGCSIALLSGYLAVWAGFALAAASIQVLLQSSGLTSSMMLWSQSAFLSAGVLALAGIYQLTPLKRACLAQCRGPVQFLTRHWRPGRAGAFRMGVLHGAYCVGCCWLLMALLFVGGVMNLAWIAALSVLVLAEKVSPAGPAIGIGAGIVLLAWALATLLV
jgi:predicted metal-binding membrane protein